MSDETIKSEPADQKDKTPSGYCPTCKQKLPVKVKAEPKLPLIIYGPKPGDGHFHAKDNSEAELKAAIEAAQKHLKDIMPKDADKYDIARQPAVAVEDTSKRSEPARFLIVLKKARGIRKGT